MITLRVPYDEARIRRTLRFLLRRQVRTAQAIGGVLLVVGVIEVALRPDQAVAYVAILLGLWWLIGFGPTGLRRSMRAHRQVFRHESSVTLDDEWITVIFPQVELRHRWTGIDRVVEGSEAWYVMVGRAQALVIPKDRMTSDEQTEFAAFVSGLSTTTTATDQAVQSKPDVTGQPAAGPAVRPLAPPES
jgi:hypothetical protein